MKEQQSLGKDILFTTLVLVIIAIIAGGILGVVHHFTIIDEKEVLNQKLSVICPNEAGFSDDLRGEGFESTDKRGAILGVYRAAGTNDIIMRVQGNGAYKQNLEILIQITDYKIKKISKYRASETYSDPFKDKKHLYQYYDKDIREFHFVLQKNHDGSGTIDAWSGATKTSTAINNAVTIACEYYIANYDTLVGGAN